MLNAIEQLEDIDSLSRAQKVLIYKHSEQCTTSCISLDQLEADWNINDNSIIPFHLDILSHEDVSEEIELRYHVYHDSPQILIISNAKCVKHLSHLDITYKNIIAPI